MSILLIQIRKPLTLKFFHNIDAENDNLFPWQLDTDKVLDEDLKKLILLDTPKK
jgi:hypothetical protein